MDACVHAERLCRPALRRCGFGVSASTAVAAHAMALDLFASDILGHYQPRLGPLGAWLPFDGASERLHFGSLWDTAAVAARWADFEPRARAALSTGDIAFRLAALGAVLHVVQDFYSHSNWSAVDWSRFGLSAPTWDELSPAILAQVELHTAAGHGVAPPAGRCTHEQLHCDHAGRDGFGLTLRAARRATEQWLAKARDWSGPAWPAMRQARPAADLGYQAVADLASVSGHGDGPEPPSAARLVRGVACLAGSLASGFWAPWLSGRLGQKLSGPV